MNTQPSEITHNLISRDELLKILPFIPISWTLIGTVRLLYYYKSFDINITEYIEISELLILSISHITTYTIIFLFQYFYFVFFSKLVGYSVLDSTIEQQGSMFKSKYYWITILSIYLILYLSLELIAFPNIAYLIYFPFNMSKFNQLHSYYNYDTRHYFNNLLFFHISCGFLGIIIPHLIDKPIKTFFSLPIANIYRFFFYYIMTLVGSTILGLSGDIALVKFKSKNSKYLPHQINDRKSYLKIGNEKLYLDSTYTYIGKTKNYYFLEKRDSTVNNLIVPVSEVKEFYYRTWK